MPCSALFCYAMLCSTLLILLPGMFYALLCSALLCYPVRHARQQTQPNAMPRTSPSSASAVAPLRKTIWLGSMSFGSLNSERLSPVRRHFRFFQSTAWRNQSKTNKHERNNSKSDEMKTITQKKTDADKTSFQTSFGRRFGTKFETRFRIRFRTRFRTTISFGARFDTRYGTNFRSTCR